MKKILAAAALCGLCVPVAFAANAKVESAAKTFEARSATIRPSSRPTAR